MDGKLFKKVDSDLGDQAISHQVGNKWVSDGYTLANKILRDEMRTANPSLTPYLDNIDHAWAMSVRLGKAAAHRADSDGKFTPADMLMAIKSADASRNHTAFAKGDALMQDFAEQANRVIGRGVKRYEDPSAGSMISGFVPGLVGGAAYPVLNAAQRHPMVGGSLTAGVPAAGAAAGSVVSRQKDDRKLRPSVGGP